jgi:hypothetical protein
VLAAQAVDQRGEVDEAHPLDLGEGLEVENLLRVWSPCLIPEHSQPWGGEDVKGRLIGSSAKQLPYEFTTPKPSEMSSGEMMGT